MTLCQTYLRQQMPSTTFMVFPEIEDSRDVVFCKCQTSASNYP